ncbi:DUF4032 domain-containing protein [Demequina sp. NBRC 110055]|uniref:DUF4032 domain-containing protein n=1 Tax=Demequina sp. NBRC 110055 TaxID=1570344 RepID=UPI0009FE6E8B|nr:DUF4032 domain-containing protein [Demequina sp. NBRC 110055]
MALKITGAVDPELLDLPWSVPLETWPKDTLAALPRGISRHVVRFVRFRGRVLAVKETVAPMAKREFDMLKELGRMGAPCVVPFAVVDGRVDDNGEELAAALVTEHLQFSLPYRALFSQALRDNTLTRLIDALAVLLVRLHLLGFYWGDVSLSNALFRRDAEAFSAYLVDAETGDLHRDLTPGQRAYDIDLARTNIIGEMFDLQAAAELDDAVDPLEVGDRIEERYKELWNTLTEKQTYRENVRKHVAERVQALNDLGFDVGELDMTQTADGSELTIRPKVVDAGHHSRRLLRLTGLDVQENQARRLLNDMDEYRVVTGNEEDEVLAAHEWLADVFEPTVRAVPREYRRKLEPAQVFHEVLDHRWFLAEKDPSVTMPEAVASYVKNVLPTHPDEQAVLGHEISEFEDGVDAAGMPVAREAPTHTTMIHAWQNLPRTGQLD